MQICGVRYTVVDAVGGQHCEIECGGRFGRPNRKPIRAGSPLVWNMQTRMEEVCGEGVIWWLKWWAHAIARRLEPVNIGILEYR